MLSTIAAVLCALLLGPPLAQQAAAEEAPAAELPAAERLETRREAWPDGTPRIERNVRVTASGEIAHGSYVRRHEDGSLAAEGAYSAGRMHGPWVSYWPSGALRSRGEFLEGRRTGKWEGFHENGALAATGHYRLGLRDGKWVYFDAAGAKIEVESGYYRAHSVLYPSRNRKVLAEVKDGRWHGRWLAWWEDGSPLLAGGYRNGLRHGDFRLWHLDGSLEPELVTGWYAEGARVEASEPRADPCQFDEESDGGSAPAPDPARLPRLARASGVQPSQRIALQEKVERFLDDPDLLQRRVAEQLLIQYGRDALPEVLNRLAELDLAEGADHDRAERLVGLLHGVCKGRGFALPGAGQGDERGDELAIARWFTWFELARDQEDWWRALQQNDLPPELLAPELIEGFARAGPVEVAPESEAAPAADGELRTKLSLLFRHRQNGTRPSEMREPLSRALDWLAAHQAADGAWDCGAFEVECARRKLAPCGGPGLSKHKVGVSALALLAFLGDGNTIEAGEHSEVVAHGLRWLLAQQDPGTGAFGAGSDHAAVYDHALATLALCEVAQFTDAPAVRDPARRALEVILAAQNPGAGWRYTLVPDGTSDTSITSWMVQALAAGHAAGLVDAEGALAGALSWLDAMTDPAVGRVGYVTPGSLSARIEGVNDHFPLDRGEALTAAALYARFLIGQDPDEVEVMARHAGLLLQCLPEWNEEQLAVDLYYWLHGTEAMAQMGGAYWRAWRAALWRELRRAQRPEADGTCVGGSWDPVGPWDDFGGRIYATALGALCLEGEYRHPRLEK